VKPSNENLANEVVRRQKILKIRNKKDKNDKNNDDEDNKYNDKYFLKMKPKNKKREALIEWLEAYPIVNENCINFIKKEAARVADVLQRAIDEAKETSIALKHGAWSGPVPYLRLIHCITDCDETRHAFLHRNDVMERPELDAQSSADRPTTGYEVIAAEWNDPNFNPKMQLIQRFLQRSLPARRLSYNHCKISFRALVASSTNECLDESSINGFTNSTSID
jgi:hypothetical protein